MADSTISFKKIPIKHKGKIVYALVDAEDYPVLSRHTWHLTGPKLYPATFLELEDEKRRIVSMHRMILGGVANIDHISRDVLDVRKDNLRRASYAQNMANSPKWAARNGKPTSSKYKGVTKANGVFRVNIGHEGKRIPLGSYKDEDDAARAYNKKSLELWGEYAWLNPVPELRSHKQPLQALGVIPGAYAPSQQEVDEIRTQKSEEK